VLALQAAAVASARAGSQQLDQLLAFK
jgi:hypothetical protein